MVNRSNPLGRFTKSWCPSRHAPTRRFDKSRLRLASNLGVDANHRCSAICRISKWLGVCLSGLSPFERLNVLLPRFDLASKSTNVFAFRLVVVVFCSFYFFLSLFLGAKVAPFAPSFLAFFFSLPFFFFLAPASRYPASGWYPGSAWIASGCALAWIKGDTQTGLWTEPQAFANTCSCSKKPRASTAMACPHPERNTNRPDMGPSCGQIPPGMERVSNHARPQLAPIEMAQTS